jgi:hypothetical protein
MVGAIPPWLPLLAVKRLLTRLPLITGEQLEKLTYV